MRDNLGVFVKLNCKSINEMKSLIIDRGEEGIHSNKYLMCAGKYDKNGWTVVFKAKNRQEAEMLINSNLFTSGKIQTNNVQSQRSNREMDRVEIPRWLS